MGDKIRYTLTALMKMVTIFRLYESQVPKLFPDVIFDVKKIFWIEFGTLIMTLKGAALKKMGRL